MFEFSQNTLIIILILSMNLVVSMSSNLKPILHVDQLSSGQFAALTSLRRQFRDMPPGEILGFLNYQNFDEIKARSQIKESLSWQESIEPVTIADVAPFMRSAPDAKGPDGCMFVLEGPGWCAKDNLGRPIIVSIGMMHGTQDDLKRQIMYTGSS